MREEEEEEEEEEVWWDVSSVVDLRRCGVRRDAAAWARRVRADEAR